MLSFDASYKVLVALKRWQWLYWCVTLGIMIPTGLIDLCVRGAGLVGYIPIVTQLKLLSGFGSVMSGCLLFFIAWTGLQNHALRTVFDVALKKNEPQPDGTIVRVQQSPGGMFVFRKFGKRYVSSTGDGFWERVSDNDG